MIGGSFIPLVPPNPFLLIIVGLLNRRFGQQSMASGQFDKVPSSLVLQRRDGTLIVNCPTCVRFSYKEPTGFIIK